jgi:hypothetical protein
LNEVRPKFRKKQKRNSARIPSQTLPAGEIESFGRTKPNPKVNARPAESLFFISFVQSKFAQTLVIHHKFKKRFMALFKFVTLRK